VSHDAPDTLCREGLDWVIDQAREYGMRLILTLTNGDPGYGGMPQYAKWHNFDTVTGFYTLPAVKVTLRHYALTVPDLQTGKSELVGARHFEARDCGGISGRASSSGVGSHRRL